MKMSFKNIGPIGQAELKLNDLTIISGENNTGKTYMTYTLYGFLKFAQNIFFTRHMGLEMPFDINKASKDILKSGSVTYAVTGFPEKAKQVVDGVSVFFSQNIIADIFSSPKEVFEKAEFNLESEFSSQNTRKSEVRFGAEGERGYRLTSSYSEESLSFNLDPLEPPIPQQVLKNVLIAAFAKLCLPKLPDPFILSAERLGISLFYRELDFTKNRLVEELQKISDKKGQSKIDPFFLLDEYSSRYAQPIKDNIDYTRDIEDIQKKQSAFYRDHLFNDIKEMMEGYFKHEGGEIRFISKARKSGRFNIPLHSASSSARGLSDFYFYLKHKAGSGQLLIIDEPESHLDPANQITLARLLARCVNAGLKILINTHSDYLIKELNNLVMLSHDFPGKNRFLKKHAKDYGESDFLNPDSISAYVCEKGTLTSCVVDHLGLNMPHFDKTIDKINRIANELALSMEQP